MIYRFKVLSSENENFYRIIEIKSEQTFLEFNNIILDSVKFDKKQISSFYIDNKANGKNVEVTLLDMSVDSSNRPMMMDKTVLTALLNEVGQTFSFIFDFFSDRGFTIVLEEIKKDSAAKKLPVCVESAGKPPQHIKIDDDKLAYLDQDEYVSEFVEPTGDEDDDEDKSYNYKKEFGGDDDEDDAYKYKDEYEESDSYGGSSDYDDDKY